ncbi:Prefoldin subunit-domain-containing protein [Lipomyces arxii]|uniref:Prefoldin subunit-domain-containing protein n=1 Tax=Lipomyces arxii TaxID=56418 RepID=UPI0034CDC2D5
MSLQMLPAGQESPEVQVSWEDQQQINDFSKLNSRLSGFEDAVKKLKDEQEYLEDVSTEIELIDEDDMVPYKIGDSFYWIKQLEAVVRIEQATETTSSDLEELEAKVKITKEGMDQLKELLYNKFGNAINLER